MYVAGSASVAVGSVDDMLSLGTHTVHGGRYLCPTVGPLGFGRWIVSLQSACQLLELDEHRCAYVVHCPLRRHERQLREEHGHRDSPIAAPIRVSPP